MRSNGFLDEEDLLGTVRDLLAAKRQRPIVAAKNGHTLSEVINLMKEHSISQVPVLDEGRLSGYATVTPQTKIKLLMNIFNDAKLVCVLERDDLVGVITKIDLIEYLASKRA